MKKIILLLLSIFTLACEGQFNKYQNYTLKDAMKNISHTGFKTTWVCGSETIKTNDEKVYRVVKLFQASEAQANEGLLHYYQVIISKTGHTKTNNLMLANIIIENDKENNTVKYLNKDKLEAILEYEENFKGLNIQELAFIAESTERLKTVSVSAGEESIQIDCINNTFTKTTEE